MVAEGGESMSPPFLERAGSDLRWRLKAQDAPMAVGQEERFDLVSLLKGNDHIGPQDLDAIALEHRARSVDIAAGVDHQERSFARPISQQPKAADHRQEVAARRDIADEVERLRSELGKRQIELGIALGAGWWAGRRPSGPDRHRDRRHASPL